MTDLSDKTKNAGKHSQGRTDGGLARARQAPELLDRELIAGQGCGGKVVEPAPRLQRFRLSGEGRRFMRLIAITILAAGAAAALPFAGGMFQDSAPPRVTVIYKNMTSPTLEELGQKAGDPSAAGAPEEVPLYIPRRKAQWI